MGNKELSQTKEGKGRSYLLYTRIGGCIKYSTREEQAKGKTQ